MKLIIATATFLFSFSALAVDQLPCEMEAKRLVARVSEISFGPAKGYFPKTIFSEVPRGGKNRSTHVYHIDMETQSGEVLSNARAGGSSTYRVELVASLSAGRKESCFISSIQFE